MKKSYKTSSSPHSLLEEPLPHYDPTGNYQLASHAISKKYIKHVMALSHLSVSDLIGIIPVSLDTYKRKNEFNPPVTEKILEVEEVYRKGLEVFGEKFHQWMDTENIALGGINPKQLLSNSFGVRMLLDQIGRMEHGILA